jgi:hypothetical protein
MGTFTITNTCHEKKSLAKLLPENYTNQQNQEGNNGACDDTLLVHSIDNIYIHLSGWISCKHCSARQQTYRRIIAFRVFDARSIEPSAVRSCQWFTVSMLPVSPGNDLCVRCLSNSQSVPSASSNLAICQLPGPRSLVLSVASLSNGLSHPPTIECPPEVAFDR